MKLQLRSIIHIGSTLLACMFLYNASFALDGNDVKRINASSTSSSMVFIENVGQITNQHGVYRGDIDFKLESGNMTVFIGEGQLHYMWTKKEQDNTFTSYRLDATMNIGNGKHTDIIAEEEQPYYEMHYNDRHREGVIAKSYKKITYKNIAPGMDWVLYINDGQLKYDFVLHKEATELVNYMSINYSGATSLTIQDGAVTATTPFGSVTEAAPYTYNLQTNAPIASKYSLNGNSVGFEVAETEEPFVIDPSLEWATYYGGTNTDKFYAVVADTSGNVYAAGITASTNIVTNNAHQYSYGGLSDGILIKMNAAGLRQFATYFGGARHDNFFSLAIDANQNIYAAGITDSSTTLGSSGIHQSVYGGGVSDCFLTKFNPAGSLQWCTYYGGPDAESSSTEYQTFVAVDGNGGVYLVGNTKSTTGIASSTSSVFQGSNSGNIDGFLAKFNTSGIRQWATYVGGTADDNLRKIAFDNSNNVYVAGETYSTGLASSSGVHQSSLGGNKDAFISKFSSSGGHGWTTYYGGSDDDSPQGLAIDVSGNIFLSGSTLSTSGIASLVAHQTQLNQGNNQGASDAYIVKFNSSGIRQWGTYYGGHAVDHSGDLIIDSVGNAVFTGSTGSTQGISTIGSHQSVAGGGNAFDALLAVFSTNGQLQWGSYYGGNNQDYGYGICNAPDGVIYIAGFTESNNNIWQSGYQVSRGGGADGFLAKFSPDTSAYIVQPFNMLTFCQGDTFSLPYGVTNPFFNTNTFTVQLSSSNGSFTNPTNIGTRADSLGNNKIFCTIPMGTTPGTQYRIRIVSSSPADTSFDNGLDITIKQLPAKPIAGSNTPVCTNDTIEFTANSATSGLSWSWTGPGGYTSAVKDATRTGLLITHAGDYVVTGTLNGCSTKDTTTVVLLQAPDKPVAGVNTPVCSGGNISLTATSGSSGLSWSWGGPAGFNSLVANPTINGATAANSGQYIVSATASNACTAKDTINVTVIPTVTINANINATPGAVTCPTGSIQLNVPQAPTGSSYVWTKGGNSFSTNPAPSITNAQYADSGWYKVKVTLNACSEAVDSIYITVADTIQQPSITANSPVCDGYPLTLNFSHNNPNVTFYVSGPNIPTLSNIQNLTINPATNADAGDYLLEARYNGCKSYDTINVTVKPTPKLTGTSSNSPLCEEEQLTLGAAADLAGATFEWKHATNGFSSTNQNVTINNTTVNDAGTYIVTAILNGCRSKADSVQIDINQKPRPDILSNAPICVGETLMLDINDQMTNVSYSWQGPDNFSSSVQTNTITNVTLAKGGIYTVTATSDKGCITIDTQTIVISPPPGAMLLSGNTPVCDNDTLRLTIEDTSTNVTYSWAGPDGYTATVKNSTRTGLSANSAGYYIATANRNGCTLSDTIDVVVKPAPPTPSITVNSPVPSGGTIQFNVTNPYPNASFSWTGPNNYSSLAQNPLITPASFSNAGTYTVTTTFDGCSSSNRVIVQIEGVVAPVNEFILWPNPNNGKFRVRSEVSFDQEMPYEVVDILGRIVYRGVAVSQNNKMEEEIQLDAILPSGVYIFRMQISGRVRTVPFTISR